ncbi:MAG: RNA polymerase sigma factor, partial [Verrucomicrobiales bacterium]
GRQPDSFSEDVLEALGAERESFPAYHEERLDHLSACIRQLAPQARKSIYYRYHDEHLPPAIARLMGCSVESVHVTLSRARAFLRDCVRRKLSTRHS